MQGAKWVENRMKARFNLSTLLKHGSIKESVKIESGTGPAKYLLTTSDDSQFLLKYYSGNQRRDVIHIADFNKAIVATGIKTPTILESGITKDGLSTYELIEWIPGKPLDEVLENISANSQYKKGLKAGELLKEIHMTRYSPIDKYVILPLHRRVNAAMKSYYESRNAGIPTYHAEVFKHCLFTTSCDIRQVPVCLLHGDYHVGNIIEDNGANLWVIDWVYGSFGDPVEDFVRIFVSANRFPHFARGQVDGYYSGAPSLEFWQKLKYYTALHQLEILPFSLGLLPSKQTIQEHQQTIIMEQYEEMNTLIPRFYNAERE